MKDTVAVKQGLFLKFIKIVSLQIIIDYRYNLIYLIDDC